MTVTQLDAAGRSRTRFLTRLWRWEHIENSPRLATGGCFPNDAAPGWIGQVGSPEEGNAVNYNTVVNFLQPGEKLPPPPTASNITLRRSMGLVLDPDEVDADLLFCHDSFAAAYFQMAIMLGSWRQTPAGSLPNDAELIWRLARKRIGSDPNRNGRREFNRHRASIMRGWYLCSDGRLYHPFVARQVKRCWLARTRTTAT